MFHKALLLATYEGGSPGKRTKEHEEAEFHEFKTEYLFKGTKIPRELYVARLIQQYEIMRILEIELQKLTSDDKSAISAFFALDYLEFLWRTPAMKEDLIVLGVNLDEIADAEIMRHTMMYLEQIKALSPKLLLAHFLLHVSGFMHGGNIILTKYIKPSNKISDYQIPSEQYNFSRAMHVSNSRSPIALYTNLMKSIEGIDLTDAEFANILDECKQIYIKMKDIYDDLLVMHTQKPTHVFQNTFRFYVSLAVVAVCFSLLIGRFGNTTDSLSSVPAYAF